MVKKSRVGMGKQGGNFDTEPKFQNYLKSVKDMNSARLNQEPFNAMSSFKKAAEQNGNEQKNEIISSCWGLMGKMLGFKKESDGFLLAGSFEAVYEKARVGDTSDDAIEFRANIVRGARDWLQENFHQHLSRHVREQHAELGGRPSPDKEVDSYIKLKFFANGRWSVGWLDHAIGKTPFWAHLYYLVRMGLKRESLEYLEKHSKDLKASRDANFVNYFKAWCNSSDGRLPKAMRDSLLGEWNARIRDYVVANQAIPKGDAFKYTLYKIIGRCELNIKTIRNTSVIRSSEDYIWLQTMLISEQSTISDSSFERYSMADFGNAIDTFGRSYFKKIETWFIVLLCSGRFEKAINELINESYFVIDAIHFAIMLAYYGVLKVPANPKEIPTSSGLLSSTKLKIGSQEYEVFSFHFSRMISQITREWGMSDAGNLMQYVYLIGMFGKPLDSVAAIGQTDLDNNKSYTLFSLNLAKEILLSSEKLSDLIGKLRSDGRGREVGVIEKNYKLLNLTTEAEYLDRIVLSLADECDREGRLTDAIELYNLSGQPNKVLQLLNREIGEYLLADSWHGNMVGDRSLGISDPVETASNVMDFYQTRSLQASVLNPKIMATCQTLVSLALFKKNVDAGNLENSLKAFMDLDIVPFSKDNFEIQKKANSFSTLDASICRVLPNLIVSLATVISQLYHQIAKSHVTERDGRLRELKSFMRSILTFCGLIQYQIPSEVFAKMNRLDVMMT